MLIRPNHLEHINTYANLYIIRHYDEMEAVLTGQLASLTALQRLNAEEAA